MSKALKREAEGDDEAEPPPAHAAVRNLITPSGLERLRDELARLRRVERPKVVETVAWAAANGDRSENGDYIYGKRRLRQIDARIRFLAKRLEIAEPVDPARQNNRNQVFLGAVVTFRAAAGRERTVRIVGIDEAGVEERDISWVSPVPAP